MADRPKIKHAARRSRLGGKPGGFSQVEIRQVLRSYNVGRLQFVRPGGGSASPAVIAVTDRGTYFLKRRNPRYCSVAQLSYDHGVMHHLARAGLPVVPAMRAVSGSRWLVVGAHVYEVYPLVEGREHTIGNEAQIEAAGRLLSKFHLATTGFVPAGDKPHTRMHDPRDSLRGLRWARERTALGTGEMGERAVIRRLIAAAEGVLKRLPDDAYWALPQCIIHGDYHPANMKFAGDEIAGLFDFDWVGRQPRMVDVADGLLYGCGIRPGPLDPADIRTLTQAPRFDQKLVASFGRGYASGIQPTAAELRALPDLLRARWLFSRVDAMERKIPEAEKVSYLIQDVEVPLQEIAALEKLGTVTYFHKARE
jgi:homoserine kinase type II